MGTRLTDPWVSRRGLEYTILRLTLDDRPAWVRTLGMREVEVNGAVVGSRVPPRLRYSRKLGSFAVLPYDPEAVRARDEALANDRLAALRVLHDELQATPSGSE